MELYVKARLKIPVLSRSKSWQLLFDNFEVQSDFNRCSAVRQTDCQKATIADEKKIYGKPIQMHRSENVVKRN